jgi:hypothetical protein
MLVLIDSADSSVQKVVELIQILSRKGRSENQHALGGVYSVRRSPGVVILGQMCLQVVHGPP